MSSLCFKALELNQFVTEKLLYTRFLLNFNSTTQRFEGKQTHYRLKYFYVTWLFITATLWPISTFYVIFYKGVFHPDTVSSDRLFFTIIVSAPGILCIGINYGLLRNTDELADYLNLTLDLRDKFIVQTSRAGIQNNQIGLIEQLKTEFHKLQNKESQKQIDVIGLLVISATIFFAMAPICYIPGPLITRADPFSYPVQCIFEYDEYPLWLYIPFRIVPAIGAVICTMEAVRSLRTVIIIIIVIAQITANLLKNIDKLSRSDLSKAMERYTLLYAIHVKSMRPGGFLMLVCIEGGMFIAIISLTGTFVGWKILSPFLYWLNPLMAVSTVVILAIAAPYASFSAEMSLSMISQWQFRIDECKRGSRRLNKRILKSFQIVAFYANGLGYVVKETKTRIFSTIVMNTVDTVLMTRAYVN